MQPCPTCRWMPSAGDQFCEQCGTNLATAAPILAVCPGCGLPAEHGDVFCGGCGTSLTGGAPGPRTGSGIATTPPPPPQQAAPRQRPRLPIKPPD